MTPAHIQGIGMTSQRTRTRLIERLREEGIRSDTVLAVMESTPRHLFIDEAMSHRAYEDTALPIGRGQTISQPYIVALMTQTLLEAPHPIEKVLEIGTGCGYQSLILSKLFPSVFTVERIDELKKRAQDKLRTLNVTNVSFHYGDGWQGWEAQAPYDGIIVTAAAESIPDKLVEQLSENASMVIPVGQKNQSHELMLVQKKEGEVSTKKIADVRFVPLIKGALE